MLLRPLGRSGLTVPPLCLGGNTLGWTADCDTSFAILDRLAGAGLTFIDTADSYSVFVPGHQGGESERIIGEWLASRGNRHRLTIATKVGAEVIPGRKGLSRSYIREAVEGSLRRLRTDYIDLYQAHRDDRATPLEETLAAFAELIAEGKVRAIGASNYTAERLRAAERSRPADAPRFESLQPEYNLFDRAGFEQELASFCEAHEIGAISYYGLAHGFLTGKYRSPEDTAGAPRAAYLARFFTVRGMNILAELDAVADQLGTRPAQVALAWLAGRPGVVSAIASATSVAQADDLVAAASLNLPPALALRLDEVSA